MGGTELRVPSGLFRFWSPGYVHLPGHSRYPRPSEVAARASVSSESSWEGARGSAYSEAAKSGVQGETEKGERRGQ